MRNDELGTAAGPGTMGLDVPTVELDQPLHHRETDSEAALRAVELGLSLGKRSKMCGRSSGAMPSRCRAPGGLPPFPRARSRPRSARPVACTSRRSLSITVDDDKPPKAVTIRITHPNPRSPKYDALDLKLRDMLHASGIEPKEPVAGNEVAGA